MKKILLKKAQVISLACLMVGWKVQAQQVPNSGFENWANQNWLGSTATYEPENWLSYNYANIESSGLFYNPDTFPVMQSSDAYEGFSSIKLSVVGINQGAVGGTIISTNSFDYSFNNTTMYPHHTGVNVPDSLVFWYKFKKIDPNSSFQSVICVGTISNWDINGSPSCDVGHGDGFFQENDVAIWTRKSVPIDYLQQPTSGLYVTCGFTVDGGIGTELKIDAVELVFNPSNVGMEEQENATLQIFPNPVKDKINLEFEAQNEDYTISILDLQGRVLQTQKYQNLTGNQNINFKLNDLKSGKYIVKMESNKATASKMIVVE